MRSLLLGLTIVAAIPGVVHADIMSSGPAYGGSTQSVAVCYIFNGGTTNLTVTKVDIIKEPFGEIVPVVTQNVTLRRGPRSDRCAGVPARAEFRRRCCCGLRLPVASARAEALAGAGWDGWQCAAGRRPAKPAGRCR